MMHNPWFNLKNILKSVPDRVYKNLTILEYSLNKGNFVALGVKSIDLKL